MLSADVADYVGPALKELLAKAALMNEAALEGTIGPAPTSVEAAIDHFEEAIAGHPRTG